MGKITRVKYTLDNPDGFANPDMIPMVCPGCGMIHGFTSMDFYRHLRKCPELKGKEILMDEAFNMKCVPQN